MAKPTSLRLALASGRTTPERSPSESQIYISSPPSPIDPAPCDSVQALQPNDFSSASFSFQSDERVSFDLVLVTGGAGYIGSHTVLEILQKGELGVVIVDTFDNSAEEAIHRVRLLAASYHVSQGLPPRLHPPLYSHKCDIRSAKSLAAVIPLYPDRIKSCIHFAALKSVPQSISNPIDYYSVNVAGTLTLISELKKINVKKLVFSSSAVVYGAYCEGVGIKEEDRTIGNGLEAGKGLTNAYGRSKWMCEQILTDLCTQDSEWSVIMLRYTNPSGNHPSGLIGEDPVEALNLMPIVTQVLQGRRDFVRIFGYDFDTIDTTGVRDFIHVSDLATGHLAAMEAFETGPNNCKTYNLGTGQGHSVASIIETMARTANRSIKTVLAPRRAGDLGCVVCDPGKAERELGWKATRTLDEMCKDLWKFVQKNPSGVSPRVIG